MREEEIKGEIITIDRQVEAIVVNDVESFEVAGGIRGSIDGMIKKIKVYWKEPKEKAYSSYKELVAKEKQMLNPVESKKTLITAKINAYLNEVERKKKEEQRRLDEERRKKEEIEREKLRKRAEKARDKGKEEKAEALEEKIEEVYIPPSIVEPEVEKTTQMENVTVSKINDIEIEITDPKLIYQGIAKGELPIIIAEIKPAKLKKYIKDFGVKELPGCRIIPIVKSQFRSK